MKVTIKASSFALPSSEILGYVEPSLLSYIKGFNEKPLLKAYVVASNESGITPGFEPGYKGPTEIKFTEEAVRDTYVKASPGKPIHLGHWEDDPDEEGRETVGTVVGKALKKIGDKLYSIVVCFFNKANEEVANKHDSISMEADWVIASDGSVTGVEELDAVALVPEGESPAFPTAKSVGTVKAHMAEPNPPIGGLDWHQLEAEARRRKALASQLTDPEEMLGDLQWSDTGEPILTGIDKKYVAKAKTLIMAAIEKQKAKVDPSVQEKLSKFDEMAKKLVQYESKPLLLQKAKERNLGEAFVAFIEKRSERFKPSENLEASIKEFLDDKAADFSDLTQSQTGEIETPDPEKKAPTVKDKITDYDDPKQNPFLEG